MEITAENAQVGQQFEGEATGNRFEITRIEKGQVYVRYFTGRFAGQELSDTVWYGTPPGSPANRPSVTGWPTGSIACGASARGWSACWPKQILDRLTHALQHDFSNPYLVVGHDKQRLCQQCGMFTQQVARGLINKACNPRPGWREAWEASLVSRPVPTPPRILPYRARDLLAIHASGQDARLMGLRGRP